MNIQKNISLILPWVIFTVLVTFGLLLIRYIIQTLFLLNSTLYQYEYYDDHYGISSECITGNNAILFCKVEDQYIQVQKYSIIKEN